jgi:hypothetical protein
MKTSKAMNDERARGDLKTLAIFAAAVTLLVVLGSTLLWGRSHPVAVPPVPADSGARPPATTNLGNKYSYFTSVAAHRAWLEKKIKPVLGTVGR